ncbi:EamA/RhaT family transporter, partial [Burkholderia multivorans]
IILAEVPPPLAAAGGDLRLVGAACAIGPQTLSSLRASAERSG